MILNCPGCGTLFRHAAAPAGVAARCSCCSEVFPFPAPRRYRVASGASAILDRVRRMGASEAAARMDLPALREVAAGPASMRHASGADDPTLASRLERMAHERGFAPMPEPPAAVPPPPDLHLDRMIEELAEPRTIPVAGPLAAAIVGAGATYGASAWVGGTLAPAVAGMGAGALAGWMAWRWVDTKR